ncbi:hypothetical protein AOC05_04865 [Arthrobacter alpinus]|uniref:Uncharacterized protein n=1 Tax=Arthrobacter alpinus TaxID=656366 RepID=A0A0M4RAF0_9MICC|nr:hypothetical protein AOC05_04865 [Arthrobacter alpinus]
MKKPDESYGYLLWMDVVRSSAPPGRLEFLRGDARRWVSAGSIYGLAVAYTPGHVCVSWHSTLGYYMRDWLPAVGVHSIPDEQWHGLQLVDDTDTAG